MTSDLAEHRQLLDLYRAPLGQVRRESNRVGADISSGLMEAAENLLHKAMAAVERGDDYKARAYVERAVRLPFDEHEGVAPAWWAAQMLVFRTVTDVVEELDQGDVSWLDAAAQVLDGAQPGAALALCSTLATIAQDYQVTAAEERRVRALAGSVGPDAWAAQRPDDTGEQVDAIVAALHFVPAYERALDLG